MDLNELVAYELNECKDIAATRFHIIRSDETTMTGKSEDRLIKECDPHLLRLGLGGMPSGPKFGAPRGALLVGGAWSTAGHHPRRRLHCRQLRLSWTPQRRRWAERRAQSPWAKFAFDIVSVSTTQQMC